MVPIQPPTPFPEQILTVAVNDSIHQILSNSKMGVWNRNTIFCIAPLRKITLDNNLHKIKDSLVDRSRWKFLTMNNSGTKLLLVQSLYSDVSMGALFEFDISSGTKTLLKDSSYNISSSRFFTSDDRCIYYCYGNNSKGILAGYYVLDIPSKNDTLLFQHESETGPLEIANGFDISPDKATLLYPIHYYSQFPIIVQYNINSKTSETLNVPLGKQFLWLRYHPSENKIVYSNYPRGSGGNFSFDTSEVGQINMQTLAKTILPVNTNTPGYCYGVGSINTFPDWSSDGNHIVYGSSPGPDREPPAFVGNASLYILKNVR